MLEQVWAEPHKVSEGKLTLQHTKTPCTAVYVLVKTMWRRFQLAKYLVLLLQEYSKAAKLSNQATQIPPAPYSCVWLEYM